MNQQPWSGNARVVLLACCLESSDRGLLGAFAFPFSGPRVYVHPHF